MIRSDTEGSATEADKSTSADNRFRRKSRVVDKISYSRVFSSARRSSDRLFTVLFSANDSCEPRLGLAIAKKQCRLATGRNRLKRIIRESFRVTRKHLPGIDIVVLNRVAAAKASNRALFCSLEKHWRRCSGDTSRLAGKR